MKNSLIIILSACFVILAVAPGHETTMDHGYAKCSTHFTGVCPPGTTQREGHDMHHCENDNCNVQECCGARCSQIDNITCRADQIKRGEHDNHMFYGDISKAQEECCMDTHGTCNAWNGVCPAGTQRRHSMDLHQCDDGNCNENECCGQTCSQFDNITCRADQRKRGEHDGHMFYGGQQRAQDECCMDTHGTCMSWDGSCPAGSVRRHPNDMHHCEHGNCNENECCGRQCNAVQVPFACPEGTTRRGEHDGHQFYGNAVVTDECCIKSSLICKSWTGTCPAGTEKRSDDDMHHCSNGVCNEDECCGRSCRSFTGTCDEATEERRRDDDGHMFYANSYTNPHTECCVKTCGKNFKGTCPAGFMQRHADDFHDCSRHTQGEPCGVSECCAQTCQTQYFDKGGSCPEGKMPRSPHDFHQPSSGKFNADECCNEPSRCEASQLRSDAPVDTLFHVCNRSPESCQDLLSSFICGNGCYSQCWQWGKPEWGTGALAQFGCPANITVENACNGFPPSSAPGPSPSPGTCKQGECCGQGTEYKNGHCVPSYGAMEGACKEGNTKGLEWFCNPINDIKCDK